MRRPAWPPKQSQDARRLALALFGLPVLGAVGTTRAAEEATSAASGSSKRRETFDAEIPLGLSSDGRSVTVGEWPGRVLLVCFWASWCPHCRAEIPVLERIQSAVSPEHLRVVLVNTEPASDWRRVRRHLEGKLGGLMTHDPERTVRQAFTAAASVPHTVLVGRDGRRRATLNGWSHDSVDGLVERVNQALAEPQR